MRHPILSRVPLVFLGTCFRWAITPKVVKSSFGDFLFLPRHFKSHFSIVNTHFFKIVAKI